MSAPKHITAHLPDCQTEANQKFVTAYRQMFKEDPDVSASLGYDNGKAIMLTLEKLGGQMPADGAQFISTMRGLTFDAPRGKIRFNSQNSALLEKVYLVEIVKRSRTASSGGNTSDEFPGADDLPGCTKSF